MSSFVRSTKIEKAKKKMKRTETESTKTGSDTKRNVKSREKSRFFSPFSFSWQSLFLIVLGSLVFRKPVQQFYVKLTHCDCGMVLGSSILFSPAQFHNSEMKKIKYDERKKQQQQQQQWPSMV